MDMPLTDMIHQRNTLLNTYQLHSSMKCNGIVVKVHAEGFSETIQRNLRILKFFKGRDKTIMKATLTLTSKYYVKKIVSTLKNPYKQH